MYLTTPEDDKDDRTDDSLWDGIVDLRANPANTDTENEQPQVTDLPSLHITPWK